MPSGHDRFRSLLKRYIRHVRACEGCDFLDHNSHEDILSPYDLQVLMELSQEGRTDAERLIRSQTVLKKINAEIKRRKEADGLQPPPSP